MSLKRRITVTICSIIIILLSVLSYIIFIKSASIMNENAEILMHSQLKRAQENIDLLIKNRQLETEKLALDRTVRDFLYNKISLEEINQYLVAEMEKKNLESNDNYKDLFILNTKGFIIATCMPIAMDLDLSMREYFKKSLETKGTVTSDVLIARSDKSLIVITTSPIFNERNQIIALAGIAIKTDYLADIVKDLKLGENGYYIIVDSNNLILSHPQKELIATEATFFVPRKQFNSQSPNYDSTIQKKMVLNHNGQKEIQSYQIMKSNNWVLIAVLPEKELLKWSMSLLNYIMGIGAIIITAAVFIGIYISNRISIPIVAITEYIDQLAKGNMMLEQSVSESIKNLQNNNKALGKEEQIRNLKKYLAVLFRKYPHDSNNLIKTSQELIRIKEDTSYRTAKFIATLSHDLKTSISLIKGSIKGITSGIIQDEKVKKTFLENIYYSAEDLERITCDILDSAYEAQGCLKLNREFLKSKDFAEKFYKNAQELIERSDRLFEGICDCEEGLLYVDSVKIKRVWDNLLNNAIKYTEEGSRIHIAIRQKGEKLEFKVRDEGMGINEGELDKIFNMFYQGEYRNKGYGLGLFIAKSIIDAHDSKLCVASRWGEGTTFWFELKCSLIREGIEYLENN